MMQNMKRTADPFDGFVQISLFAYEPDWIDLELCRGSGFQDGHKRIVEAKAKGLPIDAFAKFLKNEYGTGGHCGPGMCYENHDSKGMEIENRDRR